ncbi:M14 family zinc carboxypeptidase [Luteimonas sp. RIT-PG2_3]
MRRSAAVSARLALLLTLPVLGILSLTSTLPTRAADTAPLQTLSERSGFLKTGRYDEVASLCAAFARDYPDAVRCQDIGLSPEGRAIKALIVTRSGAFTPDAAATAGLPVVLVQGGIHAGESDGKDAGFLALREVLDGQATAGVLDKLVWIFVPLFNVDGHERFSAWNRPNQRGPEEMGWRTNAQNQNLNRDYAKADSVEMQAMLRLLDRWDPLAYIDLHATNGAQFEHDISIQVEPIHSGDRDLQQVGLALREGVIADLARQGSLPLPFYPSFIESDNPASGIEDGVAPPRFSNGYYALRNRLVMLVETHSWKPYPVRVRITRNTVVSVLEQVARHGRAWRSATQAADRRTGATLAGQEVALSYKATPDARIVDFRGYAYTRTYSDVSGALMTRYDEHTPQIWKMPVHDQVVADRVVRAPRAGYVVPAAHAAWVGEKLALHGIAFQVLAAGAQGAATEVFRADQASFASGSFEGHQMLTLSGRWSLEPQAIPAGSLYVPIAQPRGRLAMALLEPQAPDSLAAWGRFNNHFERKEYMEPYVAEAVAREMLATDPDLKIDFERRLRDDPAFAGSAEARLDYFYRRHSAWDTRFNLYPVYRLDTAPAQ